MKFCSLTRELCADCKLIRKLAACSVVERFIKDIKVCPKKGGKA